MQGSVKFSNDGGVLRAALSGEIDHHSARSERDAIDAMLFKIKPNILVLDFSEVKFMDSSGIGLIIGRSEVAEGVGCRISVAGLSPALLRLVRLSGIEKLKNIKIE